MRVKHNKAVTAAEAFKDYEDPSILPLLMTWLLKKDPEALTLFFKKILFVSQDALVRDELSPIFISRIDDDLENPFALKNEKNKKKVFLALSAIRDVLKENAYTVQKIIELMVLSSMNSSVGDRQSLQSQFERTYERLFTRLYQFFKIAPHHVAYNNVKWVVSAKSDPQIEESKVMEVFTDMVVSQVKDRLAGQHNRRASQIIPTPAQVDQARIERGGYLPSIRYAAAPLPKTQNSMLLFMFALANKWSTMSRREKMVVIAAGGLAVVGMLTILAAMLFAPPAIAIAGAVELTAEIIALILGVSFVAAAGMNAGYLKFHSKDVPMQEIESEGGILSRSSSQASFETVPLDSDSEDERCRSLSPGMRRTYTGNRGSGMMWNKIDDALLEESRMERPVVRAAC